MGELINGCFIWFMGRCAYINIVEGLALYISGQFTVWAGWGSGVTISCFQLVSARYEPRGED